MMWHDELRLLQTPTGRLSRAQSPGAYECARARTDANITCRPLTTVIRSSLLSHELLGHRAKAAKKTRGQVRVSRDINLRVSEFEGSKCALVLSDRISTVFVSERECLGAKRLEHRLERLFKGHDSISLKGHIRLGGRRCGNIVDERHELVRNVGKVCRPESLRRFRIPLGSSHPELSICLHCLHGSLCALRHSGRCLARERQRRRRGVKSSQVQVQVKTSQVTREFSSSLAAAPQTLAMQDDARTAGVVCTFLQRQASFTALVLVTQGERARALTAGCFARSVRALTGGSPALCGQCLTLGSLCRCAGLNIFQDGESSNPCRHPAARRWALVHGYSGQ